MTDGRSGATILMAKTNQISYTYDDAGNRLAKTAVDRVAAPELLPAPTGPNLEDPAR
jgi:YD repeat-containing protein